MSSQWFIWTGCQVDPREERRDRRSVYVLEETGFTSHLCAVTLCEAFFSFLRGIHVGTGAHPASQRGLFPRGKAAGLSVYHSTQSWAEIKNEWSCSSTQTCGLMACRDITLQHSYFQSIPVAALSKARVCGPSRAGIAGSNLAGGMNVCLL